MKIIPPVVIEAVKSVPSTTTLKEEHEFLKGHLKNLSLYSTQVKVAETNLKDAICHEAYKKLLDQICKVYTRIEEIEQLPYWKILNPINVRLSAIETHKGS